MYISTGNTNDNLFYRVTIGRNSAKHHYIRNGTCSLRAFYKDLEPFNIPVEDKLRTFFHGPPFGLSSSRKLCIISQDRRFISEELLAKSCCEEHEEDGAKRHHLTTPLHARSRLRKRLTTIRLCSTRLPYKTNNGSFSNCISFHLN